MSRSRVGWVECLLVGIVVFGMLGTGGTLLGIAGMVLLIRGELMNFSDFDPTTIIACAAVAASIVGILSWRFLVANPDARPTRGAAAGLLVGFLSHPLCWAIATLSHFLGEPTLRRDSLADSAFSVVFMTLLASFSSLGLTGWITMPLGAFLGYCTRRIQQFRSSPDKPRQPGDVFLDT